MEGRKVSCKEYSGRWEGYFKEREINQDLDLKRGALILLLFQNTWSSTNQSAG